MRLARRGEVVVYYDTLEDPDFMHVAVESSDNQVVLAPMPRMNAPEGLPVPVPYSPTPQLGHWSFRTA